MPPTYGIEELKSLRDKGKETEQAVVTKMNHERGIKEHVLRSSSGESSRTVTHIERPSSALTNPYEGFEQPPNDDFFLRGGKQLNRTGKTPRFSPTPSVRRGKVAALLREHASPPGVRVTAGGRLVPDGTSPLTSPRFDNVAKYENYPTVPHLVPSSVPSTQALSLLDGMIVNVGGNRICQIVSGRFVHVGYTNSTLNLQMPPTNPIVPSTSAGVATHFLPPSAIPIASQLGMMPGYSTAPSSAIGATPDPKLLDAYESKLCELQAARSKLDRDEVLQREQITPVLREQIVDQRKSLTNQISEVREIIKSMKENTGHTLAASQHLGPFPNKAIHSGFQPLPAVLSTHHASPSAPPAFFQNGNEYPAEPMPTLSGMSAACPSSYPGYATSISDFGGAWPGFSSQDQGEYFFPRGQNNPPIGAELAERPENVGLGITTFTTPYLSKTAQKGTENAGMNLDGSGVQPRRSHAIEIKKPAVAQQAGKSALNPTSPSYDPSKSFLSTPKDENHDNSDRGTPSPGLEIEMEKILRSPKRLSKTDPGPHGQSSVDGSFDNAKEVGSGNTAAESFQTSSTTTTAGTAATVDFFPNDPHLHSGRNFMRSAAQQEQNATHLSNWMPKENEAGSMSLHVTPVRSINKFRFKDSDSPEESSFKTAADASTKSSLKGPTPRDDVTAKPVPPRLNLDSSNRNTDISEKTDHLISGSAVTSFDSHSHCEHILTQKTSGTPKRAAKNDAYWAGFTEGIKQELCAFQADEDYRRGYRDGLLRSKDQPFLGASPFTPRFTRQESNSNEPDLIALSRRSSFPAFQAPRVPSNTATNSPLRQSSENEKNQGQATVSFDSALPASARILSSSAHGAIGVKNSVTQISSLEPISPLAERSLRNVLRQPNSASKAEVSASRVFSGSTYEQQRYPRKGQTSVAPSTSQARGWIPHQYDGSADDDEHGRLKETRTNIANTSPPLQSSKGKDKASVPASPIKRASSAVYKLTQLGGMSKRGSAVGVSGTFDGQSADVKPKKEDDPSKMSSPEKAKWRNKWRKRFEELKNVEQKEIDEYKRTHPIS